MVAVNYFDQHINLSNQTMIAFFTISSTRETKMAKSNGALLQVLLANQVAGYAFQFVE